MLCLSMCKDRPHAKPPYPFLSTDGQTVYKQLMRLQTPISQKRGYKAPQIAANSSPATSSNILNP